LHCSGALSFAEQSAAVQLEAVGTGTPHLGIYTGTDARCALQQIPQQQQQQRLQQRKQQLAKEIETYVLTDTEAKLAACERTALCLHRRSLTPLLSNNNFKTSILPENAAITK
jgi:hypothetical protein